MEKKPILIIVGPSTDDWVEEMFLHGCKAPNFIPWWEMISSEDASPENPS